MQSLINSKMFKQHVEGRFGANKVDDMTRLRRFLILGCEGGTYYASEKQLGIENAVSISRLLEAGRGAEVVAEAVACSENGRAAKQKPTLFVLAMCARLGNDATRSAVYKALPRVARTPTMLFEYLTLSEAMTSTTGWGRGLRRAIAEIYGKDPRALAMAVTKYRSRDGWNHRDVLRLAHVKPTSVAHQMVLHYAAKNTIADPTKLEAQGSGGDGGEVGKEVHSFLEGVEEARVCEDMERLLVLMAKHRLVREHLPTQALSSVKVWLAMLETMGLTALIRNLGKMTAVGAITPLSAACDTVVRRLGNTDAMRKARVHPFSVFVASQIYASGHGAKGKLSWNPVAQVTEALEKAFYDSFKNVQATGKRFVIAMDVSGSMGWGNINGVEGITPRLASAAMAMVAMRTEKKCVPLAFTDHLVPLRINARMSLEEVLSRTSGLPFGATDCAQPMLYALQKGIQADVFVVYTDCETWAGKTTPAQALRNYRSKTGIDAKLIVVAMTSGGFTIADPEDAGMLDVVGFDANAPSIMSDFVNGNV